MDKIKTFEELKTLNRTLKSDLQKKGNSKTTITVGMATCGIAAGAKAVFEKLNSELLSSKVKNTLVSSTGCLGYCYAEPVVEVRSPGVPPVLYGGVDEVLAARIIKEHIIGGCPIKEFIVERGDI